MIINSSAVIAYSESNVLLHSLCYGVKSIDLCAHQYGSSDFKANFQYIDNIYKCSNLEKLESIINIKNNEKLVMPKYSDLSKIKSVILDYLKKV